MKEAKAKVLMIAAPGSRHGKTMMTAALARQLINQGQRVQVIKLGPDYLDPMVLECASRKPVYNLDWWMMGEAHCRQLLFDAAVNNDVVLVESLMGLHDNQPSNAWLSRELELPVCLVMDMAKYAQTAAAIVEGMRHYDGGVSLAGVVGNRLGSEHHHTLVKAAMPDDVRYCGSIRRDDRMQLPERHLGLVQASELTSLNAQLNQAAQCLTDYNIEITLPEVGFSAPANAPAPAKLLAGKTIAIARDEAFSFIYPANIDVLQVMGANCVYFSPLANQALPNCDSLWLPGGYPELYAERLSKSTKSADSIRAHLESGKPGLAECGGMMVLGKRITDKQDLTKPVFGLIDADFLMHSRFQSVGHQSLTLHGETIHGHSFHHSSMETSMQPIGYWQRRIGENGEAVYQVGSILMSYGHLYFQGNPTLVATAFAGE